MILNATLIILDGDVLEFQLPQSKGEEKCEGPCRNESMKNAIFLVQ